MSLRLYNTLTSAVEPFVPLEPGRARMYVCGPTVYDDPHIGHARSAYVFDLLRRHLEHRGLQVTFVRNVTDVDDKIIEKAKQELAISNQQSAISIAQKCREVAERYLKSYHDVLERLGIGRPTLEPKATEHVNRTPDDGLGSMTDLIAKLLVQGAAYEAGGDVYFAVRKFPGYGALSHRSLDELQAGARVEPGERKQDPLDFALWKSAKPGEPSWKSPWGEGRPGWHIECSAMSTKYLGDEFDIHGGGVDLVFPHHDNEIAQARAAGKKFARVWIHNGLLTVNGEKMSKSMGNFVTIDQAIEAFHWRCVRSSHERCQKYTDPLKVLFLGTHYRSPLDYTESNIQAAYLRWFGWAIPLDYIHEAREEWQAQWRAHFRREELVDVDYREQLASLRRDFEKAMEDDLNTPKALACLDSLAALANAWQQRKLIGVNRVNTVGNAQMAERNQAEASIALDETGQLLTEIACLLGLDEISSMSEQPLQLTEDQQKKLEARETARKRKDFAVADGIRWKLDEEGVVVEDTPRGPVVRRKL